MLSFLPVLQSLFRTRMFQDPFDNSYSPFHGCAEKFRIPSHASDILSRREEKKNEN